MTVHSKYRHNAKKHETKSASNHSILHVKGEPPAPTNRAERRAQAAAARSKRKLLRVKRHN